MRAARAKHRHGQVLVKAYLKPDQAMSLRPLVQQLKRKCRALLRTSADDARTDIRPLDPLGMGPVERETLADVAHALPYQKVVETATAGYVLRQWLAHNLYDRIR